MSYTSYFIQTFLRQPNREKAREYLGLGGGSGGDVTESDLDFSDVTTANSTAAQHGLLPKLSGNVGDVLRGDGTFGAGGGGGSGDVVGPASSVDDRIVTFDGVTGRLIQDSGSGIAVVPTANQKAALAGTSGAPAAGNPYVTDSDPRLISSGGTVTSVGLTAPSILSVAGSPVTTLGSLDLTLANQNANLIFAGPASGAAATPTFRALVAADIPFSSDWTASITRTTDQIVSNNATPQNDNTLLLAVDANSFYLVQLILLYTGNNITGDYRGRFTFPAMPSNTAVGFVSGFTGGGLGALVTPFAGASTTAWPTGDMILGVTGTITDLLPCFVQFMIRTAGAAGTLQYQFSNSVAALGRDSITLAGSTLRHRKFS